MPLVASVVVGLALHIWPFEPAQTVTYRYAEPVWRVAIRHDRFTGIDTCRLYQGASDGPSVAYARQSLAFRFPPRTNTLEASFKLDGRAARRWGDVYPALVAARATLPGGSLENPTGGLVILPLSVLAGAHLVVIRPTPTARPRSFSIDGLGDTIASARQYGCVGDTAFTR